MQCFLLDRQVSVIVCTALANNFGSLHLPTNEHLATNLKPGSQGRIHLILASRALPVLTTALNSQALGFDATINNQNRIKREPQGFSSTIFEHPNSRPSHSELHTRAPHFHCRLLRLRCFYHTNLGPHSPPPSKHTKWVHADFCQSPYWLIVLQAA